MSGVDDVEDPDVPELAEGMASIMRLAFDPAKPLCIPPWGTSKLTGLRRFTTMLEGLP